MLVPREQVIRIAEMLEHDPTIESVEIDRNAKGRIVVHSIQMTPVKKRMRLTRDKSATPTTT